MTAVIKVLALDVGEKRIGVAWGDSSVKIATPYGVIAMGETAVAEIEKLISQLGVSRLVIGLPRNSRGEETKQSQYVRNFAKKLAVFDCPIAFQDESLTSVEAENILDKKGGKFAKSDIDSHAAAVILSDYLESRFG